MQISLENTYDSGPCERSLQVAAGGQLKKKTPLAVYIFFLFDSD